MIAARTPGSLFAHTEAPTPLPQIATPRSTFPAATARANGTTKSVSHRSDHDMRAEIDHLIPAARSCATISCFRLNPP